MLGLHVDGILEWGPWEASRLHWVPTDHVKPGYPDNQGGEGSDCYRRWRCVSLNALGYFNPYPSSRSNPMWANRMRATKITNGCRVARPRLAITTGAT